MSEETVKVQFEGDASSPVQATEQLLAILAKLDATLQDVQNETKKTGEETEKTEKKLSAMERTTKGLNDRWESLQRLGGTLKSVLGGVGAALGTASALVAGATAGYVKLSEAGSEQEKVNRRLSASINATSTEVAEATSKWDALQDAIAQATGATDFGDEELAASLATMIDLTGSAETARRGLNAAMGISAAASKSLEESSKLVAKAAKGEVEALKELTPLNKEQAAALASIKDPAERGARALEILDTQYGGLANTVGTVSGALKEQSDSVGDLQQAVGLMINKAGGLQAILGPVTALLREQESWVYANSVAVQNLALDFADGLVTGLEVFIEAGSFAVKSLYAIKTGLEVGFNSAEIFLRGISILGTGILYFSSEILSFAIGQIEHFLGTSAKVAAAIGADGIAASLREAQEGVKGFRDSVNGVSAAALTEISSQMASIERATDDSADAMTQLAKDMEGVEAVADKARAVTDKMRAGLAQARAEVKPLESGFDATAKAAGKVSEELDKIAGKSGISAEELKLRMQLLEIERQILEAQAAKEERRVAELAQQRAQVQSELDLLGAKNQELGLAAQRNALRKAELEYAKAIDEIERRAREEAQRGQVFQLKLAALQTEDETQRRLLEIEVQRLEISHKKLLPDERAYELAKLEREEREAIAAAQLKARKEQEATVSLAARGARGGINQGVDRALEQRRLETQRQVNDLRTQGTERAREEAAALQELVRLEAERAQNVRATTQAFEGLATQLAAASTQGWDLVKGQEAYIGALSAAGAAGAGLSSLLVKDRAKLAAIEAIIQGGLAVAATAMYVKSGGVAVNYLAAAAGHTSAAVSLGVAAARGGESGGGAASVGMGAGGGGAIAPPARGEDQNDRRSLTRDLTQAVREGMGGATGPAATNYIDMRGALLIADSPEGRRTLANNVVGEMQQSGMIPRVSNARRP